MSVMKRTKDETKVILTEDDFSQRVHCEKNVNYVFFSVSVKTRKVYYDEEKKIREIIVCY